MNKRQERAVRMIVEEVQECINGFKRTMNDYPVYSDEYEYAADTLRNHDSLVEYVYEYLFCNYFSDCIKDLHFCGKNWLCSKISYYAKCIGY